MKKPTRFVVIISAFMVPALALADIKYNLEHSAALDNLHAIESASLNMHYQCKGYSLFISAYATESEVHGLKPSISGKIVSKETSFDISDDLSLAFSREDILAGNMSVSCNGNKGAFQIKVTPNEFGSQNYKNTTINIHADGSVSGMRFLRSIKVIVD